jgi:hypothetical protein
MLLVGVHARGGRADAAHGVAYNAVERIVPLRLATLLADMLALAFIRCGPYASLKRW